MPVREERLTGVRARHAGTAARPRDTGDDDLAVYSMSVAAGLTGLPPQTLRAYDRADLVRPRRSDGGNRLYSPRDVERLRRVHELPELGINREGVRRILALEAEVEGLAGQLRHVLRQTYAAQAELVRASLTPGPVEVRPRTAVERWRPSATPGD
ncbi:MAG: MerR family transcriptional regulator [Streptosporangiales bacterium]|nr:MerR family transcriptional regulator [Streptosporangiales bacterium]